MNKQLLELRKKFRGQTAKVEGRQFNNDPLPEGKYVGKITRSEIKEGLDKDNVPTLQHRMMIRVEVGEAKGRTLFPFSPDLNNPDMSRGILACATNIQNILGDVVPGKMDKDGNFEMKTDAFLDEVESLAHQCEGEMVEVTVKNQKPNAKGTHLRDGKPRQNVYINRGLGDDAKAVVESAKTERTTETVAPDASLAVGRRKKPVR